jgi:hypothetical protein
MAVRDQRGAVDRMVLARPPGGIEQVILATWTLDHAVRLVMADAGMARQPPQPAHAAWAGRKDDLRARHSRRPRAADQLCRGHIQVFAGGLGICHRCCASYRG